MIYLGVAIMVLCSMLNSFGQFLFKACVPKGQGPLGYGYLKNPKFSLGVAIYVLGTLLNIYAYRFADLIILYPLTNLSLVWNMIFAGRVFGEEITPRRIAATLLIMLGCGILVY